MLLYNLLIIASLSVLLHPSTVAPKLFKPYKGLTMFCGPLPLSVIQILRTCGPLRGPWTPGWDPLP